jgi:hypothetical protein
MRHVLTAWIGLTLCGVQAMAAPPPRATDAAKRNIHDVYERAGPGVSSRLMKSVFGSGPADGRRVAVVMGLSDYTGGFRPLAASYRDALNMRDYLIDEAGFDYVVTLTNAEATKENIRRYMIDVVPQKLDRTSRDGRLRFYFSGHGTQDSTPTRTLGYLPMVESGAQAFSSMVSMD